MKQKTKFPVYFALGSALALTPMLIFIAFHWPDFLSSVAFRKEYNYSTPSVAQYLFVLHKFTPKTVVFFAGLIAVTAYAARERRPRLFFWLLWSIPLMALALTELAYAHWSGYPVYLSLLSLLSFFILKIDRTCKNLLLWIFVPACVGGIITSITSASGYLNAQVGMIPAAFVSLYFLAKALRQCCPNPRSKTAKLLILVSLSAPHGLMFLFPLNIWNDSPLAQLTDTISVGPFKGIRTAPEKKRIAEVTHQELAPLLKVKGHFLSIPISQQAISVTQSPLQKGSCGMPTPATRIKFSEVFTKNK